MFRTDFIVRQGGGGGGGGGSSGVGVGGEGGICDESVVRFADGGSKFWRRDVTAHEPRRRRLFSFLSSVDMAKKPTSVYHTVAHNTAPTLQQRGHLI